MRRFLIALVALFVLSVNIAQASDLYRYSDDSKIISALSVLENVGANDVIARLEQSKTKIIFYDLSLISFSYAKHYAVASTDDSGDNYILINQNYRSSPKEAIACLIAHESVHQLPQATLDEEVRATTAEARTWIKLQNTVSTSADNKLITRLNKLADMYRASTPSNNLIAESIANNSFYREQLALK